MAKQITRTIKREVVIPSSIGEIPETHWILEIGPLGIKVHKKNERKIISLKWRSIIALALIRDMGN